MCSVCLNCIDYGKMFELFVLILAVRLKGACILKPNFSPAIAPINPMVYICHRTSLRLGPVTNIDNFFRSYICHSTNLL